MGTCYPLGKNYQNQQLLVAIPEKPMCCDFLLLDILAYNGLEHGVRPINYYPSL